MIVRIYPFGETPPGEALILSILGATIILYLAPSLPNL
jgi:hypothetical protein